MSDDGELWVEVVGWDRFQHYRDRNPAWIKTYVSLLHDPAWLGLTHHQRGVLLGLWLEYAAAHRQVVGSTATISRQLGGRVSSATLKALSDAGFIHVSASRPLAARYHDASPETEREKDSLYPSKNPRANGTNQRTVAARQREQARAGLYAAAEQVLAEHGRVTDSLEFDDLLDQLERQQHAQLTASERTQLWDAAR